jgi:lipoprotein-releasing system permease protein
MFIAKRYVSKKGGRSRTASVLAILGIATGVLSLTVIISVMNGFQLGFIESIIEISSYHVRIENFPEDNTSLIAAVKEVPGVQSAVPYLELKGILKTRAGEAVSSQGGQSAALLRGIPPSAARSDSGMAGRLSFEKGAFNLDGGGGILLGSVLAESLGLSTGGTCEFLSLSNMFSPQDGPQHAVFTVRGIFRTGFYEYDASWALISIEDARAAGHNESGGLCTLGIKLKNREADRQTAAHITAALKKTAGEEYLHKNNIQVRSWRDYNKAFFNALRTEKLMMFFLVGLIFIITAMNIYHAQRRAVLERSDEIGLMRAVGATSFSVRMVFALNGFIVGLLGSALGMAPALLIATHIQEFFTGIEAAVNTVLHFFTYITGGFSGGGYSVFSPAVFYLKEIPSRVLPHEIAFIFLFGFSSAVIAAYIASARAAQVQPAEILRYE